MEGWLEQTSYVLLSLLGWITSFFTLKHMCCCENLNTRTPGFDLLKRALGLILGSPGSVWENLASLVCFHSY